MCLSLLILITEIYINVFNSVSATLGVSLQIILMDSDKEDFLLLDKKADSGKGRSSQERVECFKIIHVRNMKHDRTQFLF